MVHHRFSFSADPRALSGSSDDGHAPCDDRINLCPAAPIRLATMLHAWNSRMRVIVMSPNCLACMAIAPSILACVSRRRRWDLSMASSEAIILSQIGRLGIC